MNTKIAQAEQLLAELNDARAETKEARHVAAAARQREMAAQTRETTCESRFLAFLEGKPDPATSKPFAFKVPNSRTEDGHLAASEPVHPGLTAMAVPKQLRAYFTAHPDAEKSAEDLVRDGHIKGELATVKAKLNMLARSPKNFLFRVAAGTASVPARFRLRRPEDPDQDEITDADSNEESVR